MAIAWNLGFGKPFQKHYGASITKTLQHYSGKSTGYYVDSEEYARFNKHLEHLLASDEFINSSYDGAKDFLEMAQNWSERAFSGDLGALPSQELAGLYNKFALEMQPSFYSRMWMVYRISHPLEAAVEKKLLEATQNEAKALRLLKIFSSPLRPNNAQEERMEALLIASRKGKLRMDEYGALIKAHAEKYAYMPMYGIDHEPFSEAHFRDEIDGIREPRKEFTRAIAAFRRKKRAYDKALLDLRPARGLANLLRFYSEMICLRDYRDTLRGKTNLNARKMYTEIGRRAKLSIEETNLLTNEEIISFLRGGTAPGKAEIKKRKRGWLIIQNWDKVGIYSGSKAGKIATKELGTGRINGLDKLMGQTGSPGYAVGIARIIHTNRDLGRIKKGDIMITSMTRQDYVHYLRRCAALVTDEGGITSHAAVICREMKIPCIVGTELATNTFKNGDRLEVDANKGIAIRIGGKNNLR